MSGRALVALDCVMDVTRSITPAYSPRGEFRLTTRRHMLMVGR